jgi:hypothetical protein
MAVTTRLDGVFFQRAFLVAQLTSVKRIILLAFDQEAGGRDLVVGTSHLAPSLAVFFVPEMTGALGRDVQLAS